MSKCMERRILRQLVNLRHVSSSSTSNKGETANPTNDLIGQPHPISNLRAVKFYIPKNENDVERQYRIQREEVQKWNEKFWIAHNTHFIAERKKFLATHKKDFDNEPMSPDKLSVFYKRFLDEHWKIHLHYNYEWYKKNAGLVVLALRVKLHRLKMAFFQKNS
ncbi:COA8 family protein CBG23705, mitochondrial-like [Nilaparvata lugens]|uniref:COA8 family protein CBG23705, mitochondrial n=1 Tax=Nilaparvata lugens TaxID=108931 RepID=UPI000B98A5B9|nr:COA8 family protein CBG23705, mitochondrial [Nilaparvata lugens]XP_039289230.1 COA8 family protein CBG23705, mitochondrial [Nilaparvata lugens]XP_039289232.1 COA8 family protein CBG23705, mitochondrial-like [Nilaparvata lugens]